MQKNKIFITILLGGISFTYAQTNQINFDDNALFRKAKNLFYTETYLAANHEFSNSLKENILDNSHTEAAEYYAMLTNLINGNVGAEEQFLAFQEKYPKSVYTTNGAWELGSFYLKKGDINKAYKYLTLNNIEDLPTRKREEYQFKLGYVNLMKGKINEALTYLEPLTNSERYENEANFYVGHIYYDKKDFAKAMQYFNTLIQNAPAYEDKILPYLVQIEFNNKEYKKAIADGEKLLAKNKNHFIQSEVSKIIGESYFKLKDYNNATPYLENYTGTMSNADYYQLGYAYYEQKKYTKAVSFFNKIVNQENAWAQTAYYQLGNAYLKINQKQEALSAYHSAAKMNYNKQIQEDAAFNYAKLSYDVGNPYESTVTVLKHFTTEYPHSKYKNKIERYLADAFISSGDYKNAIAILEKVENKNQQELNAEQLAAFLYGTELFKEGKNTKAKQYLDLAIRNNTDKNITQRAYFWSGEIAYRQGLYNEAVKDFEKFKSFKANVEESKEVDYQLGYAYLKLKDFTAATQAFKSYLATNPPGEFKADAQLRLADSYVGSKNNDSALSLYEEIAKSNTKNTDEATYNAALMLGIKGNTEAKAKALESFIVKFPVSKFNDEAKLELADAYIQLKSNEKALLVLNDLIKTTLHLNLKAEAQLRKGLILHNQGKDNEAIAEFKTIVETYPRSKVAYQAIENIKRIYIDKGDFKGFENWAKNIDFYNVNTSEIENLAYDEAMRNFDAKNYTAAIPLLKNFINQYPNSNHLYSVNYALGEAYYQTHDYNNALKPLSEVAKFDTENKADALLRLAQIYLAQNKDSMALLTLENLYKVSNNTAYSSYAEINLMQLYNKSGNHEKALAMANKVLENTKNEKSITQEAELIKAESLFANGNLAEAKKAYQILENSENNTVKAEALYYKAFFLNQEKEYKKSNKVIFDLASKYAEQQLWGSQALVLMAENYYKLGDLYQANYTLKTVIENYQNFPEVIAKAKALQKEIKNK